VFDTKDTGGTPVADGATPVQMLPCGQHAAWLLPSSAHCWPLRQQTPIKAEPLSSQLKKPPGQLTARCSGANSMKLASATVPCASAGLTVGDAVVVIVAVAIACAKLGVADAQRPMAATAAVRRILVKRKNERQQCRRLLVTLPG